MNEYSTQSIAHSVATDADVLRSVQFVIKPLQLML